MRLNFIMLDIFVESEREERLFEEERKEGVRLTVSRSTTKLDLGRGEVGCERPVTGTTGASVGTVAALENRSKRFWRNRRYSSSL